MIHIDTTIRISTAIYNPNFAIAKVFFNNLFQKSSYIKLKVLIN